MAKIYLKIVLMLILGLIWCIGVCGADALMDNGHWFVLICMVILPVALCKWACRRGMLNDVFRWFEKIDIKW